MTWLEEHQRELALLNKLGRKEACGSATEEEICRLRALKIELGIRATDAFSGRDSSLTAFEQELDRLDAVRERVETFLEDKE